MSRNTSPRIRATTEHKTFPDMRTGRPVISGESTFQIRQGDEKSRKRSEKTKTSIFADDPHYAASQVDRAFARKGGVLSVEWEWARSKQETHFKEENCGTIL